MADHVRIYPYAVSGTCGIATLKGGTSSIQASLFESSQTMGNASERVEVITLVDAIRLIGEQRIALLKVDIEGAEKELFATIPADALAPIQRVVLEYHDYIKLGARAAVEAKLRAGGFSIVRINPVNMTAGILYAQKG